MGSASEKLGKTLPPTAAVAPLPHWPIPPRLLLSAADVKSRPASQRPRIRRPSDRRRHPLFCLLSGEVVQTTQWSRLVRPRRLSVCVR